MRRVHEVGIREELLGTEVESVEMTILSQLTSMEIMMLIQRTCSLCAGCSQVLHLLIAHWVSTESLGGSHASPFSYEESRLREVRWLSPGCTAGSGTAQAAP